MYFSRLCRLLQDYVKITTLLQNSTLYFKSVRQMATVGMNLHGLLWTSKAFSSLEVVKTHSDQ